MNPILTKVATAISKRSVGILAGIGIAGFVGAMVMVAKETPKANLAIDNATSEKGEDLTVKEKAKVYAKHYWKPAVLGTISAVSVVASVKCGAKKRAAIEAAYILASNALTSQSNKIVEKYGKDAFEALQSMSAGEKIENVLNSPSDIPKKGLLKKKSEPTRKEVIENSTATQLYWDAWRGVPFETTPTRIISAVSEANKLLRRQDELTINEFFNCLDVKHFEDEDLTCRMGDKFGWSNSLGPVELEYKIIGNKNIDGREYFIMGFNKQPLERLYS